MGPLKGSWGNLWGQAVTYGFCGVAYGDTYGAMASLTWFTVSRWDLGSRYGAMGPLYGVAPTLLLLGRPITAFLPPPGLTLKMVPYKERDLRAAPQFLTPLVDRSVVAGYTVTLNCAVRGHPKVWGRCGVSMGWEGGMGSLWGLYGDRKGVV